MKRKGKIFTLILAMTMMFAFAAPTNAVDNDDAPIIVVSSADGSVGDVVGITLSLVNNPGIVSMLLDVYYDKEYLRLVDFVDAGVLGNANHYKWHNFGLQYPSPYKLMWNNGTKPDDFFVNGVIITLNFEIIKDVAATQVTVTYSSNDTANIKNAARESVFFEFRAGTVSTGITIEKKTGDINGDGTVDGEDMAILFLEFGKSGDEIGNKAADINGDGKVDAADLSILVANFGA